MVKNYKGSIIPTTKPQILNQITEKFTLSEFENLTNDIEKLNNLSTVEFKSNEFEFNDGKIYQKSLPSYTQKNTNQHRKIQYQSMGSRFSY